MKKNIKLIFGCKVPPEKRTTKHTETSTDDQLIPLDDLLARYKTNSTRGLSAAEAKERLAKNGPNRLTPPEGIPEYVKFLKQMFGGFSLLLWAGAFLCFLSFLLNNDEDNVSFKSRRIVID